MPRTARLAETHGDALGRARVTGYCIRFRTLRDIDLSVLEVLACGLAAFGVAELLSRRGPAGRGGGLRDGVVVTVR